MLSISKERAEGPQSPRTTNGSDVALFCRLLTPCHTVSSILRPPSLSEHIRSRCCGAARRRRQRKDKARANKRLLVCDFLVLTRGEEQVVRQNKQARFGERCSSGACVCLSGGKEAAHFCSRGYDLTPVVDSPICFLCVRCQCEVAFRFGVVLGVFSCLCFRAHFFCLFWLRP